MCHFPLISLVIFTRVLSEFLIIPKLLLNWSPSFHSHFCIFSYFLFNHSSLLLRVFYQGFCCYKLSEGGDFFFYGRFFRISKIHVSLTCQEIESIFGLLGTAWILDLVCRFCLFVWKSGTWTKLADEIQSNYFVFSPLSYNIVFKWLPIATNI